MVRRMKGIGPLRKRGDPKRPETEVNNAPRSRLCDGIRGDDPARYKGRKRSGWMFGSVSRGMPGNEEEDP